MKSTSTRGFTLIELLVVIAIIGILSSVVLASLNVARGKGANAAVKANLNGIRSQAEVIADNNGQDYTTVCTDPNVVAAVTNAINVGSDVGAVAANRCNSAANAWAVNGKLKIQESGMDWWCIDSTGSPKLEANELGGATACA